jgi:hypothetical protein
MSLATTRVQHSGLDPKIHIELAHIASVGLQLGGNLLSIFLLTLHYILCAAVSWSPRSILQSWYYAAEKQFDGFWYSCAHSLLHHHALVLVIFWPGWWFIGGLWLFLASIKTCGE